MGNSNLIGSPVFSFDKSGNPRQGLVGQEGWVSDEGVSALVPVAKGTQSWGAHPPHFPRHTRPASSSPLTPACCLLRHLPNCSLAQGFSILAAH